MFQILIRIRVGILIWARVKVGVGIRILVGGYEADQD